jgi:hypothetical protein
LDAWPIAELDDQSGDDWNDEPFGVRDFEEAASFSYPREIYHAIHAGDDPAMPDGPIDRERRQHQRILSTGQ